MDLFAGPLGWLLDQLVQLTGNYGLAIILTTIIVRLLLFPLTISQNKSMVAMRRIQPELNEIQKKYANNKEEQQKKTMELYQKHKINPLGGCLPMLVQLPILWAFFAVLREIPADGATFLGLWVLSEADPYYVFPVVAALTTFLQSKMTATDPSQKSMLIVMPIMILFFSLSLPSGLVLYWITSNVFSIVQQAWINKMYPVN
ncbi:MAG: YidC/Oxa1 family membrane protein insertase [Bacillota bacterium]|jgi:YidC/Oxa1 family membrane protein insertase|nr:YidC/Oxa1 family membrane protein insertase [Bacillota bacterium]HHT89891.1 YidC/Oxa1 family membrane protein insertase [Bacillota bacterium]